MLSKIRPIINKMEETDAFLDFHSGVEIEQEDEETTPLEFIIEGKEAKIA